MSNGTDDRAVRALERHEAFEPVGSPTIPLIDRSAPGNGEQEGEPPTFALTSTMFDTEVGVVETAGGGAQFVVAVRVPMLSTAALDPVGPAVENGWFETLERRLADAPMATRAAVELDAFTLRRQGETAVARYTFSWDDPEGGSGIAKTIGEYVEGTYVEGVVPGYAYDEPVATLLARASGGDSDGSRGPTPL